MENDDVVGVPKAGVELGVKKDGADDGVPKAEVEAGVPKFEDGVPKAPKGEV